MIKFLCLIAIVITAGRPAMATEEAPDFRTPTADQLRTRDNIYVAMRITGGATVAGLLTLVGGLAWRERRRNTSRPG